MLIQLNSIQNYDIRATDGSIGNLKDFLLDEKGWVLRYLVVDPNKWLPLGKRVIIGYPSIQPPHQDEQFIPIALTREQIKNSPPLDEQEPVSREYERKLFRYYGYGSYWMGPGLTATAPHPAPLIDNQHNTVSEASIEQHNSLRSFNSIRNYSVEWADTTIGKVKDVEVDDQTWKVANLVVEVENESAEVKAMTLPVGAIERIQYSSHKVTIHEDSGASETIHNRSAWWQQESARL